jgi:dTDP-4-dehydrorhamnose 3,5-epimerase
LKVANSPLPDVLVLEPQVFGDDRGFFYESFNARRFAQIAGVSPTFVQDNHSRSAQGVLRGLHYQIRQAQGKLVRAVAGEVFDVAVDIRCGSPTFGRWAGVTLSAENRRQLWIPPGFARGALQGDRLLGAGARALHRLGRSGPGDRVAPGRHGADAVGEGCRRPAVSPGGTIHHGRRGSLKGVDSR